MRPDGIARWVFLHHRGASLFLREWIRQQAEAAGWTVSPTLAMATRPLTAREILEYSWSYDLVIDGQARPETPARLTQPCPSWRGVHVPRDPRALLRSAYYSHRHSHPLALLPELGPHRVKLAGLPLAEGLLADLDFYVTKQAIEAICTWPYNHPAVLDLPFERIFGAGPLAGSLLLAALKWLGLPTAATLIVPEATWEAVSGRPPGVEDIRAHCTGLTAALPARVEAELRRRWGPDLHRLGYLRDEEGP
jgi:hypothetical protein